MSARLILEISAARSGTNRFREALDRYPEIVVFWELLHPRTSYLGKHRDPFLNFLETEAGPLGPDRLRAAHAWLKADPVRAVDSMMSYANGIGAKAASFKVFDEHIRRSQLISIIKKHRPVSIILHRTPIDCYISAMKAYVSKTSVKADTTDIRPLLKFDSFKSWHERNNTYYNTALAALIFFRCRYEVVSYDDLYNSGASPEAFVDGFLRRSEFALEPADGPPPIYTRQDRAVRRADKVLNWSDFCAEAKAGSGPPIEADYRITPDYLRFARWLATSWVNGASPRLGAFLDPGLQKANR